ncbi:MAG: serine hydrolase [Patescibacteria group bacterium]
MAPNYLSIEGISRHQASLVAGAIALLFIGGAVGWYLHAPLPTTKTVRESGYTYISPILFCNLNNLPQNEDAVLVSLIKKYLAKTPDIDAGVYYLNPTMGKWAGVNENESFSPASMLKVPIMTALLRSSEIRPGLLSRQVYYNGAQDDNAQESIKPEVPLQPGSYTVSELIHSMIVYSDNNATRLLTKQLTPTEFDSIYTDLGIAAPSQNGPVDFMSPKTFALFLRVLYNGTYLSRENSERALSEMAQSAFLPGLRAGVPAGTTVAAKFGERLAAHAPTELHDCGIVYLKDSTYMLCVMTRGTDESALATEISSISKLVYDYVTR